MQSSYIVYIYIYNRHCLSFDILCINMCVVCFSAFTRFPLPIQYVGQLL